METILEAMQNRRSIRSYKPDPVPQELLDQIIQAGLYAPNGRNDQSPIILAVTDRSTRDQLSRMNNEIMGGAPGNDPFYGAPAVLVVLVDRSANTWAYDGPIVMENMMLAAHALGLGSCWIHRAKQEFQSPEGKAILERLGITGDYEGVGHCILGYPDGPAPQPKPRKEGRVYYIR